MALFTLETALARAPCLYRRVSGDLHGVQVLPEGGAADGGGEADQVVQASVNRYDIQGYLRSCHEILPVVA